jgi:hypothetical protein
MDDELDSFSVNLNQKHFKAALEMRDQIKSSGFEDPQFKVHATQVYKKSFTFPQIANNDYAIEQFEALNVAESNLNNDPSSESQMEAFVREADDVAHNLTERYKEQWVDPKDDRNTNFAATD